MVVSLLTIHPQGMWTHNPCSTTVPGNAFSAFKWKPKIKSVGKSNRHLATAQICQNGILDIDIFPCLTMQISSGSFISLSHSHVNNRYLASGRYRRPIAEMDEEMSGEMTGTW